MTELAVRAAYDTVAVDYADRLRSALAANPFDRAVMGIFAELVSGRVFGVVGGPADPTHLPDPDRRLQAGDVMLIAATRAGLARVLVAAQGRR